MWEEINSLLSLMIIICNVFVTPNLPSDLIVRIQFYPLYHLHENTTSQLHQKVLCWLNVNAQASVQRRPSVQSQSCSQQQNCHYAQIYLYILMKSMLFLFFPFPPKKVNLRKRQVHKTVLFPLLYLFMAHLLSHCVQNKEPKHFR